MLCTFCGVKWYIYIRVSRSETLIFIYHARTKSHNFNYILWAYFINNGHMDNDQINEN